MTLGLTLLPEFDQEMAGTRRTLARVPTDQRAWRPHPKSFTLGALASHVANIPSWIAYTIERDALDLAPVGQPPLRQEELASVEALLAHFDRHAAEGRALIEAASDERLLGPWTLQAGGRDLFTLPRIACLRTWVLNHGIHHRAQLGVYLRLLDLPVPGLYGPTADES